MTGALRWRISCCVSVLWVARVAAHGYIAAFAIDGVWVDLPRPRLDGPAAPVSSTRQLPGTGPLYELDSPHMACERYNGGRNATIATAAKPGSVVAIRWLSNWSPNDIAWIHHDGTVSN